MLDQKLGHDVGFKKNHVCTLEGIVLIQSSWNFVKISIFMKSKAE